MKDSEYSLVLVKGPGTCVESSVAKSLVAGVMPLPRECTSLADGALTIHAVADRPGYFPGQAVQAQVTLVGGPEAVVVQQVRARAFSKRVRLSLSRYRWR